MNLIENGGFEQPATAFVTQLDAGDTRLTGWKIISGSVDTVNASRFVPTEGENSLDLSGDSPGRIRQGFDTVVGQSYTLTFQLGGNPEGGSRLKSMVVRVADAVERFEFGTAGQSGGDIGWELQTLTFVATDDRTRLWFKSLEPDDSFWGALIDDVAVVETAPPAGGDWALG